MRQTGDNQRQFVEILGRLRLGTLVRDDLITLQQRILKTDNENYFTMLEESNTSLHLYPKVRMVDAYNVARLNEMAENGITIYNIFADDRYGSGTKHGQKVPAALIFDDFRKCAGIPTTLQLALQTKVMLKWNIDPLGGLCNGSVGIIKGFKWTGLRREQLHEGDLPESIFVEFEGKIDPKHFSRDVNYPNCVEIKSKSFEFPGKRGVKVARTQIPVVAAYSISIHKGKAFLFFIQPFVFIHLHMHPYLYTFYIHSTFIVFEVSKTIFMH